MYNAIPARIGFIAAAVAVAATTLSCADGNGSEQTGTVQQPVLPVFRPDVRCESGTCSVRIAAVLTDTQVLSAPLPFSAPSGKTEPIPADSSFGVGDSAGRTLSAWSIGQEERSIGVALELVSVGDNTCVIVHQTAGFDHVKRAHVVLQFDGNALKRHLEIVEGAGPEIISVWPEPAGIAVGRSIGDAPEEIERYRWDGSGSTLALIPVE